MTSTSLRGDLHSSPANGRLGTFVDGDVRFKSDRHVETRCVVEMDTGEPKVSLCETE